MRQQYSMSLTTHGKAPNGDPRAVLQLKGTGESTTVGELLRVTRDGAWFARLPASCRRRPHIEVANPLTAEAASLVGLFNMQRVVLSSTKDGFFISWPAHPTYAGRGSPDDYPAAWFKNATQQPLQAPKRPPPPPPPEDDVGNAKAALRGALAQLKSAGIEVIVTRDKITYREYTVHEESLP